MLQLLHPVFKYEVKSDAIIKNFMIYINNTFLHSGLLAFAASGHMIWMMQHVAGNPLLYKSLMCEIKMPPGQ